MNFKLKVWRRKDGASPGSFKDYDAKNIPSEASFLEMLDIVNETLLDGGEDPIAFDSDCREGICGTCSLVINGVPHGPGKGTTCQLYMRKFADGDTIWIEPFRATAFPPIKDLVVDRSMCRISPWKPPLALDAALAWPLAQIPLRCCSFRPKSRTSVFSRKVKQNAKVALSTWFGKWMNSVSGIAEITTSAKPSALPK
jgi:hypothetical protein